MTIHPMTPAQAPAAKELFNACAACGETLYRPFDTQEDFDRSFLACGGEDVTAVCLSAAGRTGYGMPLHRMKCYNHPDLQQAS